MPADMMWATDRASHGLSIVIDEVGSVVTLVDARAIANFKVLFPESPNPNEYDPSALRPFGAQVFKGKNLNTGGNLEKYIDCGAAA